MVYRDGLRCEGARYGMLLRARWLCCVSCCVMICCCIWIMSWCG